MCATRPRASAFYYKVVAECLNKKTAKRLRLLVAKTIFLIIRENKNIKYSWSEVSVN